MNDTLRETVTLRTSPRQRFGDDRTILRVARRRTAPDPIPFTDPMLPLAATVASDVNTLLTLSDRIRSSSPTSAPPDLQH